MIAAQLLVGGSSSRSVRRRGGADGPKHRDLSMMPRSLCHRLIACKHTACNHRSLQARLHSGIGRRRDAIGCVPRSPLVYGIWGRPTCSEILGIYLYLLVPDPWHLSRRDKTCPVSKSRHLSRRDKTFGSARENFSARCARTVIYSTFIQKNTSY